MVAFSRDIPIFCSAAEVCTARPGRPCKYIIKQSTVRRTQEQTQKQLRLLSYTGPGVDISSRCLDPRLFFGSKVSLATPLGRILYSPLRLRCAGLTPNYFLTPARRCCEPPALHNSPGRPLHCKGRPNDRPIQIK